MVGRGPASTVESDVGSGSEFSQPEALSNPTRASPRAGNKRIRALPALTWSAGGTQSGTRLLCRETGPWLGTSEALATASGEGGSDSGRRWAPDAGPVRPDGGFGVPTDGLSVSRCDSCWSSVSR